MFFDFPRYMLRRAVLGLIAVLLAGSSLMSMPPGLLAQGPPEPIALGQNKPGEISAANPQPSFLFSASAGQSVIVEVLGLTDGLAPQLTILTASNALVQAFGNPTLSSSLSATITFPQAGDYVLQVSGINGAVGQFALRVAAAAPAEPPTPLVVGQPVTGTLAPGEQAAFTFSTPAEASLLLSLATNGLQGLTAEISDPSGTILGTLGSALAGGAFGLPPLVSDYTLVLRHDQPNLPPVSFTLLLGVAMARRLPRQGRRNRPRPRKSRCLTCPPADRACWRRRAAATSTCASRRPWTGSRSGVSLRIRFTA